MKPKTKAKILEFVLKIKYLGNKSQVYSLDTQLHWSVYRRSLRVTMEEWHFYDDGDIIHRRKPCRSTGGTCYKSFREVLWRAIRRK